MWLARRRLLAATALIVVHHHRPCLVGVGLGSGGFCRVTSSLPDQARHFGTDPSFNYPRAFARILKRP